MANDVAAVYSWHDPTGTYDQHHEVHCRGLPTKVPAVRYNTHKPGHV